MSSGIDCGQLEKVLESIFKIPVDAAKLEKWVNGGEFETVMLGDKEVPTLRNFIRQIDERESQAAEEEINEAKAEIGALAAKIQAKIDELKAMTASAETLPPGSQATVYYNASTGEFEFGIPQGKQGIQGEKGEAPAIDIIYGGDPSEETLSIIYGGNPALDESGDRTIVRQVSRIGTSAQWTLANPILEDGETGYERTTDGKLLWKIGDGVTHWNDLPYPSILVDKIYRFRGSVATVDDLPDGAAEGDVYNVTSTGANYAWTGETWDNLGVVQEIDPAPIKDSGNPVASGGVYAALEDMQADIAATGAPDEVTIIKNESGKLAAQDIAIGGDPADLASARGYIVDELLPWYPGYFDTPLADFDAATILGRYHVMVHKETTLNAPPILLFSANTLSNDGMLIVEAMSSATGISSVRRYRQTFMVFGSASKIWVRHQGTSGEWGTWREIIADTNIGDGIRVTNGMLSVPEYEGATATEPGTAGLVPPALPEQRNMFLRGDATWQQASGIVGIATNETVGVSKPDGDTITIDEDGTLRSKSIPFDGGSLLDIWATAVYPNFPHTVVDTHYIRPTLSSENMVKTFHEFEPFAHIDDYAIVFDEPGFYSVNVTWNLQPIEDMTHTNYDEVLCLRQQNPDQTEANVISTVDVEVDTDKSIVAYGRLAYDVYVVAGSKLWCDLQIVPSDNNTNNVKTVGFSIRVVKYPVTNEYQVSNTRYNSMYQSTPVTYPLTIGASGEKYFTYSFIGTNIVDEGHPDFDITEEGYIKVKKTGVIFFDHSSNIHPNSTSDNVDVIFNVWLKRGSSASIAVYATSGVVRGIEYNPDISNVNCMLPVEKGDVLSVSCSFPSTYSETSIQSQSKVTLYYMPSITSSQSASEVKVFYIPMSANGLSYTPVNDTNSVLLMSGTPEISNLSPAFTLAADKKGFICNESGSYVLTYEHSVSLSGTASELDLFYLLTIDEVSKCGNTIHATTVAADPDTVLITCPVNLTKGQVVSLRVISSTVPADTTLLPKYVTFRALRVVPAVEGGSANIKVDNTSIVKNSDDTISVNMNGIVAESGIDNFLEVQGNKLAVRGVQTAENELWNGGSATTSNEGIADKDHSIVKFGTMKNLAPFERRDNIVEVVDNKEFKILKSGIYHVHATSGGTARNNLQLYKKNADDTYTVVGGSIQSKYAENGYSSNLELHVDLPAGAILVFARNNAVKTGAVFVDFQRFADAALLAPALTTMHNELWQGMLRNISLGPSIVITPNVSGGSSYNRYMLLADVEHTLNQFVDPIIDYDSATGIYTILKTGTYHFELSSSLADSSPVSMGFAKITEDGNYSIGDSTTVLCPGSGVYNNVDVHYKLNAGDKICIITSALQVTGVYIEFQRFADTLEHPNHGVSTDAGNLAQVGSDLGVKVSEDIFDLAALHPSASNTELNKVLLDMGGVSGEGVNIDTLLRSGFFAANAFAGTLPDGIAGGVLINIMAIGDDGLYYGQQILISYINNRLYFRGNITGIQPGGIINWYPWACLTPIPKTDTGVGQWQGIGVVATSYTLPIGGVWAYHLNGLVAGQGVITEQFIGVKAGGALISAVEPQTTVISGLVWRIA